MCAATVSLSFHTTGREILHVCQASAAVCSPTDTGKMLSLVDRCCEITGYGIRPGLSGGGGGHSLTWGYEHRGHVALLSEMWSLQEAAGIEGGSKSATPTSKTGGGSLSELEQVPFVPCFIPPRDMCSP